MVAKETLPRKKRPFFWALPKLGGAPFQIDFDPFWNLKKLPKLVCRGGKKGRRVLSVQIDFNFLFLILEKCKSCQNCVQRGGEGGGGYFKQCPKERFFLGRLPLLTWWWSTVDSLAKPFKKYYRQQTLLSHHFKKNWKSLQSNGEANMRQVSGDIRLPSTWPHECSSLAGVRHFYSPELRNHVILSKMKKRRK